MAVTISGTLGLAVRFGKQKPKAAAPTGIIYVPVRDTVQMRDTVEIQVRDTVQVQVRDTVYVPEVREPETISALALFDTDKSDLRSEVLPELDKIAAWFLVHPDAKGTIEGHTDNTASAEHNQRLSERRALAVFMYLVDKGVDPDRLSFAGYGYTRPVAPNTTPEGRQKNRRVEIKVE